MKISRLENKQVPDYEEIHLVARAYDVSVFKLLQFLFKDAALIEICRALEGIDNLKPKDQWQLLRAYKTVFELKGG